MQDLPFLLALKAEALHLGGGTSVALLTIGEAEAADGYRGPVRHDAEAQDLTRTVFA
jgi:hypothetical protein